MEEELELARERTRNLERRVQALEKQSALFKLAASRRLRSLRPF